MASANITIEITLRLVAAEMLVPDVRALPRSHPNTSKRRGRLCAERCMKIERHHYAPTPAQREELRANAARIRAALKAHREQKTSERAFAFMLAEIQRPAFVRRVVAKAIAGAAGDAIARIQRTRAQRERAALELLLEERFEKADSRRFLTMPQPISGFGEL